MQLGGDAAAAAEPVTARDDVDVEHPQGKPLDQQHAVPPSMDMAHLLPHSTTPHHADEQCTKQEAQLTLTNPRDAFRGQSRSSNI